MLSALLKRAFSGRLAQLLLAFTTSATNLSPRQRRRYRQVRFFLPRSYRWFFEGAPQVPGQMWAFERRLLFQTVRHNRPQIVCESGTWLGGGSTYFIAAALQANGSGLLHTTEAMPDFYARATAYYTRHLPQLKGYVRFHEGKSTEVYPPLLPQIAPVDLLLLDGAEEAQETWDEFQMFAPFLASNAVVVAHDWNTDKMALMRPFVENSDEWQIRQRLDKPISVGMVVLQRVAAPRLAAPQPTDLAGSDSR